MTTLFDFEPAATRVARLVEAVPDDLLDQPTPCGHYTVGDLVDHIGGAALGFAGAASKRPLDRAPSGDASRLVDDWRTRIPRDLAALVTAWRDPEAWTGMTRAGGIDLPGEVAALVALDELVIHGWDLARATRQSAGYDGPELEAVRAIVQQIQSSGVGGVFGPPVPVSDDAVLLDRIVGLAGRDPTWQPPSPS
jgi:uncharacterized protein (TIGR03086 family)